MTGDEWVEVLKWPVAVLIVFGALAIQHGVVVLVRRLRRRDAEEVRRG